MYPRHYGTSGQLGQIFKRTREAAQRIYAEQVNGGGGEAVNGGGGEAINGRRLVPTIVPTAVPTEPVAIPFQPEPPILVPDEPVTAMVCPPNCPEDYLIPIRPPVNGDILEPLPPARPVVNGALVPEPRLPSETLIPFPIPGARPATPPLAPLDRAAESVTEGIPIQRAGMGMGGGLGLLMLLGIPLLLFGRRTR